MTAERPGMGDNVINCTYNAREWAGDALTSQPMPPKELASMSDKRNADCVNPQTIPTTIDLDAIRARAAEALPGPWYWGGNTDVHLMRLCAPQGRNGARGMHEVMDFVRWGMQGAQPRFLNPGNDGSWMFKASDMPIYQTCPEATECSDRRVYRADIVGIRHPDAEFVAHARQDVDDLLALVDELQAALAVAEMAVRS